jgi:hypothetical protein
MSNCAARRRHRFETPENQESDDDTGSESFFGRAEGNQHDLLGAPLVSYEQLRYLTYPTRSGSAEGGLKAACADIVTKEEGRC